MISAHFSEAIRGITFNRSFLAFATLTLKVFLTASTLTYVTGNNNRILFQILINYQAHIKHLYQTKAVEKLLHAILQKLD